MVNAKKDAQKILKAVKILDDLNTFQMNFLVVNNKELLLLEL